MQVCIRKNEHCAKATSEFVIYCQNADLRHKCASSVQQSSNTKLTQGMTGQRFGHRHIQQDSDTNNPDNIHFHNICREPGDFWNMSSRRSTHPGAWSCGAFGSNLSLCRSQSGRPHSWYTRPEGLDGRGHSSRGNRSGAGTDSLVQDHHKELRTTLLHCCC